MDAGYIQTDGFVILTEAGIIEATEMAVALDLKYVLGVKGNRVTLDGDAYYHCEYNYDIDALLSCIADYIVNGEMTVTYTPEEKTGYTEPACRWLVSRDGVRRQKARIVWDDAPLPEGDEQ